MESRAAQLLDVMARPLAATPTHELVPGVFGHAALKPRPTTPDAYHGGASTTPPDTPPASPRETGAEDEWLEADECRDVLLGPVGAGGGGEARGNGAGGARIWHF